MISYFKNTWMEKIRFKTIRVLGGIPTTPHNYPYDYPHKPETWNTWWNK